MFVECYRAALKRPLEEKSQQRGTNGNYFVVLRSACVPNTNCYQLTSKETNFLKKQGNACYLLRKLN